MRITTYLEMTAPSQLIPAPRRDASWQLRQSSEPCGEWARFLYLSVGRAYRWKDRAGWTNEQWRHHFEAAPIELWVGYCRGTPCGYSEIEVSQDGNESFLAYFGLLPQFIGRGLGGWLLSEIVRAAWRPATRRVWLHTCSLDHPRALANYQARGFQIYKVEP